MSELDLKQRFGPPELVSLIYSAVVEDLRRGADEFLREDAGSCYREDTERSIALAERVRCLARVVDAAICFARECTRDIGP